MGSDDNQTVLHFHGASGTVTGSNF
ncbi:MAG: hypothetical protein RLZZ444_1367, partial [Pseudomonadota bacterium]